MRHTFDRAGIPYLSFKRLPWCNGCCIAGWECASKCAGRPVVERRPISSLIPYARNARTHSSEQVSQIAASIREFGFTNPILCDAKDDIIAGHGRVLAALKLGLKVYPPRHSCQGVDRRSDARVRPG